MNSEEQNGGSKQTVNYGGGVYKVHTGPRKGKYIKVRGTKVYLNKKTN